MRYIVKTQLICLLFSLIGVIFADIMYFATYPSELLKYGQIILIVIAVLIGLFYMYISKHALNGKWKDIFYIVLPYILYWNIILFIQQLFLQELFMKGKMDFIVFLITPPLFISLTLGLVVGIILAKGQRQKKNR